MKKTLAAVIAVLASACVGEQVDDLSFDLDVQTELDAGDDLACWWWPGDVSPPPCVWLCCLGDIVPKPCCPIKTNPNTSVTGPTDTTGFGPIITCPGNPICTWVPIPEIPWPRPYPRT